MSPLRFARVASIWGRGIAHRIRHGKPQRRPSLGGVRDTHCGCGASALWVQGSVAPLWTSYKVCPTFVLIERLNRILNKMPRAIVVRR